ncbi:MAG: hypothetical protein ACYC4R_03025 [Anaerolineae bacterium]
MLPSVVALFDELQDARLAVRALAQAGFPADVTSFIAHDVRDKRALDAVRSSAQAPDSAVRGALGSLSDLLAGARSFDLPGVGAVVAAGPLAALLQDGDTAPDLEMALVRMGIAEEQANAYAESVRRDGVLVAVSVTPERVAEVVRILKQFAPVDITERAEEYHREGWSRFDPDATPYAEEDWITEVDVTGIASALEAEEEGAFSMYDRLTFGVSEEERRATRGLGTAQGGESREGPMPPSPAEAHEVERIGPSPGTAEDRFDALESDFQRHHQELLAGKGPYSLFRPAYRFGYSLAEDFRFPGSQWPEVADEARRRWEEANPGTWDSFEQAIRSAWIETKSRMVQCAR